MKPSEMVNIFKMMYMSWPHSELLKGGIEKKAPVIASWTEWTQEIDYQVGKAAMAELIKTLKFPPSVAEFREEASKISAKMEETIGMVWANYQTAVQLFGPDKARTRLSPSERAVWEAAGWDADYQTYRRTYMEVLLNATEKKKEPCLPQAGRTALPGR